MAFVANDLHGFVTDFWHLLFTVFPTVNHVKKACFNVVKEKMANRQ